MPDDFPLAARGVYCQPYLVNGRREFFAVASNGDLVAVRSVRKSQDARPVVADLWEELNEVDPLAAHMVSRHLSLVRPEELPD